ncbi:MAG: phosphate acyltransferase PlsX [Clostridia bacterium]|nr:phosphate acyltransferase PlsX [Clostridia bacterium]
MKIVVDAFGGDYAPHEIVLGCIEAVKRNPDINVVLAGDKDHLEKEFMQDMYTSDRIEIIHAPDIISNNDHPAMAIKSKPSSSIVVAYDYLRKNDDAIGLISAGSTGATLTGAILKLGRIKNVSRPALAPILPTMTGGQVLLCDCGANVDCKPINLVHFALMGTAYMKAQGVESPKVALLNVGTEDEKGDELTKEAFALLKKNKTINFVGNVEARDVLKGNVDVVVCDGFAGNVCLKTLEGTVELLFGAIKKEVKASVLAKIGYGVFMKGAFKKVKARLDYKKFGGAPLLGTAKIVVKCHGNSKASSIANAIEQVITLHKNGMIENISEAVVASEE